MKSIKMLLLLLLKGDHFGGERGGKAALEHGDVSGFLNFFGVADVLHHPFLSHRAGYRKLIR